MLPPLRCSFRQACTLLSLLVALPAVASATTLPPRGLTASLAVIVAPGASAAAVLPQAKAKAPRNGALRQGLAVWRLWRSITRAAADEGKADRLAKRSLTFGIISMSTLLLAWLPVIGGILLLGTVPMAVLAIVDGLKARRLGAEKSAGLVLGIVSSALFVLLMIAALLILVGVLVFLGQ